MDERNRRAGVQQVGEAEPGNLVRFFENARLEDSGINGDDLMKTLADLKKRVASLEREKGG